MTKFFKVNTCIQVFPREMTVARFEKYEKQRSILRTKMSMFKKNELFPRLHRKTTHAFKRCHKERLVRL